MPTHDEQERQEPTFGLGAVVDPVSFGKVLGEVAGGLVSHPGPTFAAWARWAGGVGAAGLTTFARALGSDVAGPASRDRDDRRFADPTWEANPFYFAACQGYLVTSQLLRDLVEAAALEPARRVKAEFAVEHLVDAFAPTNFLVGNPAAMKRAFETGGLSLARGLRNFAEDLERNGGWPRQVDPAAFSIGETLAATPGKVVFRNRLMELIQYAPQTETTFEIPLLLSPPWINKYYVMDLAPGRSFAEWAITRGHTVFAISYRNPDESFREVGLDDYLLEGPAQALDVIADITRSERVNIAALCLGGTLAGMLAAYLADAGDERIGSLTLLNTLLDFAEPGPLGAFVDPETVARLEKRMEQRGYLDAGEMSGTFNLLRANDLVWNYVASNWLMGESPPAFDILAWNRDSTRMPARMHSTYLRTCYLENLLVSDTMEVAGRVLRLGSVTADAYVVGAEEDHIAPWRSSYAGATRLGGSVRFVLTSSGHIAGIVNPPSPKRSFRLNDALPAGADEWLAGSESRQGSWWEDWAEWIGERAGERRKPPRLGSRKNPPLDAAPGTYVHEA
jgi:poly[(R)-3-hydroxyalkanoate] polymerase subunit PhaC